MKIVILNPKCGLGLARKIDFIHMLHNMILKLGYCLIGRQFKGLQDTTKLPPVVRLKQ